MLLQQLILFWDHTHFKINATCWNLSCNTSVYMNVSIFWVTTPKLYRFKIRYFDNMPKLYRASGLVHDKQQLKNNVEMGIVSTTNTTTYT